MKFFWSRTDRAELNVPCDLDVAEIVFEGVAQDLQVAAVVAAAVGARHEHQAVQLARALRPAAVDGQRVDRAEERAGEGVDDLEAEGRLARVDGGHDELHVLVPDGRLREGDGLRRAEHRAAVGVGADAADGIRGKRTTAAEKS